MRLLFAGTPEVAVPTLDALVNSPHEVVAVLTRADAPAGRGRKLTPSPVRQRAEELGIEVITGNPRDPEVLARLRELNIDCAPVVAYGQILRPEALDIAPHGWINLHFSLLPAWRGAAPVQRAIMAGDEITGATTFVIEEGLDSGPVLGTMTEVIRPGDTSGDLLMRLAHAGAPLMLATMDALETGQLNPVSQNDLDATYAHKLLDADGEVDWTNPAHAIDRRIRGCTPAPGAWTTLPGGGRLGLGPLRSAASTLPALPAPAATAGALAPGATGQVGDVVVLSPGEILVTKRAVFVGTGSGPVELGHVTAPGKKAMAAADWARGARLGDGSPITSGIKVGHP